MSGGLGLMKRAKSVGGGEEAPPAPAPEGNEKVLVAVSGTAREISREGLLWALTHVVQPGCCMTLLVVIRPRSSGPSSGKWLRGFPWLAGDCASDHKKRQHVTALDQKPDIAERCSQMINSLKNVYDPAKVIVKTKIVLATPGAAAIATESKRAQATWVVLDKQPKDEEKQCMEELQCNIVAMKSSQAKVLRLNLGRSPKSEPGVSSPLPLKFEKSTERLVKQSASCGSGATPISSPELGTPFTATEAGTSSSMSSSDHGNSPFSISDSANGIAKEPLLPKEARNLAVTSSDSDSEGTSLEVKPWPSGRPSVKQAEKVANRPDGGARISPSMEKEIYPKLGNEPRIRSLSHRSELDPNASVREAISLTRNGPQVPPPLCSICQNKVPEFGKPPRWFSYNELELATGGFSKANFLAEGGFGSVHRGLLSDGQTVAVKQHKSASTQGDLEFCSEVEVLSCAQHRNVVTLIGFCIEDNKRLLVYEYICNGSLDAHLYGRGRELLQWPARQKIALGAARGLRYLHEECRVGCIVHRDMRPNNILITHDFEPLVGDFGLARWQPDGDLGVQTRVIGTFGYLAPEYAQSGQITEKADVYSFGVVLLELVTGRKAIDINRPKGQQCLTEWARPLLKRFDVEALVDPRLGGCYAKHEVCWMLQAASMCIRRDPSLRIRMSQVLRILEGDMVVEKALYAATPSPAYETDCAINSRSTSELAQWRRRRQLHGYPDLLDALDRIGIEMQSHMAKRSAYRQAGKARRASFQGGA